MCKEFSQPATLTRPLPTALCSLPPLWIPQSEGAWTMREVVDTVPPNGLSSRNPRRNHYPALPSSHYDPRTTSLRHNSAKPPTNGHERATAYRKTATNNRPERPPTQLDSPEGQTRGSKDFPFPITAASIQLFRGPDDAVNP
ncbi:hypothetical protein B0T21DRAFT_348917 [Apiosordaria backusii]|uniref:Uncharacterized protein n=1 Tax=Apiosordaria backusii TaxID=314023 RepID=A0AA40EEH3_9PEZI|nr:hypothetical protein B0T21DRAFT_348917 [Apiosordaria backusii]